MFAEQPDLKISVKQTFNIDTDIEVPAFSDKNDSLHLTALSGL